MHLKWSILFYIELETTAKYQSILTETLKIWLHLLKKLLMEDFIFCAVILSQIGIRKLQNITVQVKLLFHKIFI